jgi:hypothetical protein
MFETTTGSQDVFIYSESDILSDSQMSEMKDKRADHSLIFKRAIDARLVIKELESNWIGLKTKEVKFMVYFVNPALFEDQGDSSK